MVYHGITICYPSNPQRPRETSETRRLIGGCPSDAASGVPQKRPGILTSKKDPRKRKGTNKNLPAPSSLGAKWFLKGCQFTIPSGLIGTLWKVLVQTSNLGGFKMLAFDVLWGCASDLPLLWTIHDNRCPPKITCNDK